MKHSATLCYSPLPGLCTYCYPEKHDVFGYLIPYGLSPFAKLTSTYPIEDLLNSKIHLELFSSPPFQAIVKFKWNSFARWRSIGLILIDVVFFFLFSAGANDLFGDKYHRKLMIASTILSAIIALAMIRLYIILFVNHASKRYFRSPTALFALLAYILPLITGLLDITGILTRHDYALSVLQVCSILSLWMSFIGSLCVFKPIGVFVIGKNCQKKFLCSMV